MYVLVILDTVGPCPDHEMYYMLALLEACKVVFGVYIMVGYGYAGNICEVV